MTGDEVGVVLAKLEGIEKRLYGEDNNGDIPEIKQEVGLARQRYHDITQFMQQQEIRLTLLERADKVRDGRCDRADKEMDKVKKIAYSLRDTKLKFVGLAIGLALATSTGGAAIVKLFDLFAK